MHNEWILVDGKKMAKSSNNFFTLRDIISQGYNPIAFRYLLMTAHYRTQLNFSFDSLKSCTTALSKMREIVASYHSGGNIDVEYRNKFISIIENDFDTANAIALIWTMLKSPEITDANKKATILDFDRVLGLELDMVNDTLDLPNELKDLINERNKARESKDWDLSDSLRDKIESYGYTVKDTDSGTKVFKSI